jgi:DNA repair exonuclease SbcCD ATPase subunit
MRRTLPSALGNYSGLDIKTSQTGSTDVPMRIAFAVLSDFLAQRQAGFLENREMHIRLKSMSAVQQQLISRIIALEAVHRNMSGRQTAFSTNLETLETRQNAIERTHSIIQSDLSNVQHSLLSVQRFDDSVNRLEREMSELTKELNSFGCVFESVREDFSRRADIADEGLSHLSGEIETIIASGESAQKDSMFALMRLSQNEADVKRLMLEVEGLRVNFDDHQKRIAESLLEQTQAQEQSAQAITAAVTRVSQTEADLVGLAGEVKSFRVSSEVSRTLSAAVEELRAECSTLKTWIAPRIDSLIIGGIAPLFQEFRAKRFPLL